MAVIHNVMLRFKPGIGDDVIKESLNRSMSLKDICLHPTTKKPYIKSAVAGKNKLLLENKYGLTHMTRFEFESIEDLEYFLKDDPEHQKLFPVFGEIMDDIVVVDFTPGDF